MRDVGWVKLLGNELFLVDVGKPGVVQDLVDTIGSESCLTVLVEQLDNKVLCFWRDSNLVADWVWEVYWALSDQEVHSVPVAVEEGWNADDHLVDQDSECPPVDSVVVAVPDKHFWGQVLSGATERVCELTVVNGFSETEIGDKQVTYEKEC